MRARWLTMTFAAVGSLACGEGSRDPFGLPPGNVRVSITTTGIDRDVNGFLILAGGSGTRVPPIGTIGLSLPPGTHDVRLDDLAPNCTPQGPDLIEVTIGRDDLAVIAFHVECRALTGAIEISAHTVGLDPDLNGYGVTLDGVRAGTMFSSLTITGVLPGEHVIELLDLRPNCTVDGLQTRNVSVHAGGLTRDTVRVSFAVTCSAFNRGTVRLETETVGAHPDPNGYTLRFNGELITDPCGPYYYYYCGFGDIPLRLAVNGIELFENVFAGNHTYELADLAQNCAVEGTNPRAVSVQANINVDVLFRVVCSDEP